MGAVCHVGVDAIDRLHELGLQPDDIYEPLKAASAEARMCTDLDAPGMPGYAFWSRVNRFFRERKVKDKWTHSNAQSILRCVHPGGKFAITATSASGKVGDASARATSVVRTKNPKGPATARLVEFNQLSLFPRIDHAGDEPEINDIVTWFLLYKFDRNQLSFELSLPSKMNGQFVDTWEERIFFSENPFKGSEFDIKKLDEAPEETTVDVPVDFKGAI